MPVDAAGIHNKAERSRRDESLLPNRRWDGLAPIAALLLVVALLTVMAISGVRKVGNAADNDTNLMLMFGP